MTDPNIARMAEAARELAEDTKDLWLWLRFLDALRYCGGHTSDGADMDYADTCFDLRLTPEGFSLDGDCGDEIVDAERVYTPMERIVG